MNRRGQCKFFAQGTCLKGDSCNFAHGLMLPAPMAKACRYYQRGACNYGDKCIFEHAKPSWMGSSASSSSSSRAPVCIPPRVIVGPAQNSSASVAPSDSSQANGPAVKPEIHGGNSSENGRTERIMCLLAADGNCRRGETCADIHGDLCPTCERFCLHPSNPEDREKHAKDCVKRKALLERSQEIECGVCLERVLSKAIIAERKFGLLAECDHAFCISCIKKWRSRSSDLEMDDNNARACPVCRKLSYYVIPSPIWYSSKEDKQEIIEKYKAKLKTIDCRYFNFGSGSCLHGRHCFYKHEVKPGARRNTPYNTNSRHSSRQNRGGWDDDPLGFGDFSNVADILAMVEMFDDLFLPDEEEVGDEEDMTKFFESMELEEKRLIEELMLNRDTDQDDMTMYEKALKQQMLLSGDYDEEDFLTPWQKEALYAQLGYGADYDDYGLYDDDDFDDDQ